MYEHGLDPNDVIKVILTHGHRDHISGMIELINQCVNCEVCLPFFFNLDSFRSILDFHTEELVEISGIGQTKKLLDFLDQKTIKPTYLKKGDVIVNLIDCKIDVLSPSEQSIEYFDQCYIRELDNALQYFYNEEELMPYKLPIAHEFNLHSVVLRVSSNCYNVLLPGDIPYSSIPGLGLSPIIENLSEEGYKAHVFKAPHHGSPSSFNKLDWNKVTFGNDSIIKLTPYKAKNRLPTIQGINDILSISKNSWITNKNIFLKEHPNPLISKSISDLKLNIRIFDDHFGEIRVRGNSPSGMDLRLSGQSTPLVELLSPSP